MEPPPLPTFQTNASIDQVIFQINQIGQQINVLEKSGDEAGRQIVNRAKQTYYNMRDSINNDAIPGVDNLLDVVEAKTSNWPLTILLVLAIIFAIFVVVVVLFYCMKCGQRIVERRYQKQLSQKHEFQSL